MASNGYPKVTRKAWATLRARAASAPSTRFTPSVVAAMMDMAHARSAQANTVRPLTTMGLLTEDGGLTDRGNKWRVDATYAAACQEILDDIYPSELSGLTTGSGEPDRESVETWFRQQGFGNSNANQMAQTYVMIAAKELPDPQAVDSAKSKSTEKGNRSKPVKVAGAAKAKSGQKQPAAAPVEQPGGPTVSEPRVHLNIQIHIPADATGEQINQIFASMAKHLY